MKYYCNKISTKNTGKNREKIQIHENTRTYIEKLMDYKENENVSEGVTEENGISRK